MQTHVKGKKTWFMWFLISIIYNSKNEGIRLFQSGDKCKALPIKMKEIGILEVCKLLV